MKKWQNQKREIGNRPEPHLDIFNSSDNIIFQESINNEQKYSLSHISCSYLIGVKNNSDTGITCRQFYVMSVMKSSKR